MRRLLALVVASFTLVACSQDQRAETAPDPGTNTPVSPVASTTATPTPSTESTLSNTQVKFEDVEKLAASLQPLLPPGGRVTVDPKGEMSTVSVSLPEELNEEEVLKSLERMEPVAVTAWQSTGARTVFGRRYKDDFVMLVEPFTEREPGKFVNTWNAGMAAAPALKSFTKVGRTSPTAVFLLDSEKRTHQDCAAYLTSIKSDLDEATLPDGYDFVVKVRNCGPNSINVIAKKNQMDNKLAAAADIMGEKDLLPDDTHLVVQMDGDLDLETTPPPDDALIHAVQQKWPLGEIVPVKRQ